MANTPDTTALSILNLLIAAGGLLCILAVLGAVACELGARWRVRRSLPDAWPPEPPRGPRMSRAVRCGKPAWPALPDAWPPVEEESKR
ncbi:MAG: hypothetical protein L6Q95_07300 [Planctomycetes bacterium]|nr:hypothetical protein [Planctomycetota bacterium]